MSYLVASYVIVLGGLGIYVASLWRERAALREELSRGEEPNAG